MDHCVQFTDNSLQLIISELSFTVKYLGITKIYKITTLVKLHCSQYGLLIETGPF